MQKTLKKTLSLILAIIMIVTAMPMAFATKAAAADTNEEPIVVVRGIDFAGLVDGDGNKAITVDVMDIVDIIPTIGLQYVTKNKNAVVNTITDLGRDIFKNVRRDKEGNPLNPSVTIPKYPKSAANYDLSGDQWADTAVGLYRSLKNKFGGERIYLYTFDWRLSPDELADDLHNYLENVKKETGATKLDVAACSMGAMITTAYIDKYGADIFDTVAFLSGAHNGGHIVGSAFRGDLTIDGAALGDFLVAKTNGFVKFLLSIINALGITKKLASFVNDAITTYKDQIYGDFLRECFATAYGLWALIPDAEFDAAYDFFFKGVENEYKTATTEIKKIREFVFSTEEIMDKLHAAGVKVSYVSHYNAKQLPIYSKSNYHGDGVLETDCTSNGATVATYGATLSAAQMADSKYVSPDKVINAATCKYPNETWFVKNAKHVGCKDGSQHTEFAIWLLTSDTQPTFNAKYPQFMNVDANENFIGF